MDSKERVKKCEEHPMFTKRKGETLKSYLERVDMEASARIMEAFRKNRKPGDRRKRYLHIVHKYSQWNKHNKSLSIHIKSEKYL